MPNLTVSANVDSMLAAADNAAIRTAIGLGNVTNTADSAKPVSTAQQTALDLKANLASPTITTPTIAGGTMTATLKHTEVTSTPSGTTQTVNLNSGNHQTLSLASTTGNPTITLTVPSSASSAGTLILKQHGTTPRSITWAVSSGTIRWCGTQPTWASDAASAQRIVSWRWDGSVMYLASTEVAA
jgi:hypothetical protein